MAYRPRRQATLKSHGDKRLPTEPGRPKADAHAGPAAPWRGLETPLEKVHEIGLARLYGRRRWYKELNKTGVSPAVRLGLRLPPPPPPVPPVMSPELRQQLEAEHLEAKQLEANLMSKIRVEAEPHPRERHLPRGRVYSGALERQLALEREAEERLRARLALHRQRSR